MDSLKQDVEQTERNAERGHSRLTTWLRVLMPIALTVALVWYLFQKVDFREMMRIIAGGVDYWWILLAMFLSVFSHVFRAMRWQLQLRALGMRPPLMALTCSVFGC